MAAQYDVPGGPAIIVKGIVGQRVPYNEETYAASIQRGADAPEDLFAVNDLAEVLERFQSLDVPGFDPLSAGWQPTSSDLDLWVHRP